jgi:hypothetical protein
MRKELNRLQIKKLVENFPRIVIKTLIGVYMVELKQVIERKGSNGICD